MVFGRGMVTVLMQIRPKSRVRCLDAPSEYERVVKIHVQVFAMCLDITFSRFYEPINAEIILLWIDAF
jgi:hypothetical protein